MRTIVLFLLFLLCFNSMAQSNKKTGTLTLNPTDEISFMKGTWKGEGWIIINRERKEFSQTETINSRIDEKILVIDGIGYAKDSTGITDNVIHNAFGVIYYNEEDKSMTMVSFSSTGGKMENEIKPIGDHKLEWSFKDERGGTVRFREDFSKDGLWIENGDYSYEEGKWFPFFQMTLEKQ